ncbi:uncharacterized protein LOC125937924 isoform X1 [Panthera uncia]|uniref:uncharacterized protein LOC125937924 isoform X1 n=1 Tax=Panthera uncia TaxID=29064 RepID=UPI0020FFE7B0|nr:uncharacterized protein LOC125937924 isoform X1 [Panthera uncia]XP_060471931.1 uncharacterized protein LOC132667280 isoform X1 [Panthera onca]
MLTVFQRCFDVLIVVKDILGCGVLIFIIGWPFYQYLAMLLSTTMASQLRIRRNRAKAARTKYQTEGLSTEIHFLTVLEARSPRSKGRDLLIAGMEPAWGAALALWNLLGSLSLPLSSPTMHSLSLSKSINKL